MQRRRLHARQRVELDDAARLLGQAQVQRQHVGGLEQRVAALGRVVAFGDRAGAARLAAPDDDAHAERLAVAGDELADLAEAPDAERPALERDADAEVGRHARRLQARLLPRAVLERADVVRQAAHRRHDQRPGELGRRDRRADAFGDGDAEPRAGLDVDVRADAAGLGDQLELRKLLEELARKLAALADQDQHLGVAHAHRELAEALDGVREDLGVEVLEDRCALELAHGILVVVEDDDVHGASRGSCAASVAA